MVVASPWRTAARDLVAALLLLSLCCSCVCDSVGFSAGRPSIRGANYGPVGDVAGSAGEGVRGAVDAAQAEVQSADQAALRLRGGARQHKPVLSECQFQLSIMNDLRYDVSSVSVSLGGSGSQIFPMRVLGKTDESTVYVATALIPSDSSEVKFRYYVKSGGGGDLINQNDDQFTIWVPPDGVPLTSITIADRNIQQQHWTQVNTYGQGAEDVWIRDSVTFEFEQEGQGSKLSGAKVQISRNNAAGRKEAEAVIQHRKDVVKAALGIPAAVYGSAMSLKHIREHGLPETIDHALTTCSDAINNVVVPAITHGASSVASGIADAAVACKECVEEGPVHALGSAAFLIVSTVRDTTGGGTRTVIKACSGASGQLASAASAAFDGVKSGGEFVIVAGSTFAQAIASVPVSIGSQVISACTNSVKSVAMLPATVTRKVLKSAPLDPLVKEAKRHSSEIISHAAAATAAVVTTMAANKNEGKRGQRMVTGRKATAAADVSINFWSAPEAMWDGMTSAKGSELDSLKSIVDGAGSAIAQAMSGMTSAAAIWPVASGPDPLTSPDFGYFPEPEKRKPWFGIGGIISRKGGDSSKVDGDEPSFGFDYNTLFGGLAGAGAAGGAYKGAKGVFADRQAAKAAARAMAARKVIESLKPKLAIGDSVHESTMKIGSSQRSFTKKVTVKVGKQPSRVLTALKASTASGNPGGGSKPLARFSRAVERAMLRLSSRKQPPPPPSNSASDYFKMLMNRGDQNQVKAKGLRGLLQAGKRFFASGEANLATLLRNLYGVRGQEAANKAANSGGKSLVGFLGRAVGFVAKRIRFSV